MKKTFFLLILLFAFGSSFSQKNKKEVIYLRNGSVLKGQQTRIDDEKIAVRSGQNIWVFSDAEIDTITSKWTTHPSDRVSKSWFFKTTAGVLPGSSTDSKQTPFSCDASINFKLVPKIYAGLGAGVDFLEDSYLPAFLNLEYRFRDTRISPFLEVKGGYLISLDEGISRVTYADYSRTYDSYYPRYSQEELKDQGGWMVTPSFGFVSWANENLGFSLAFGYRYHQIIFKSDQHYQLEKNYNRLSIRLGILFN